SDRGDHGRHHWLFAGRGHDFGPKPWCFRADLDDFHASARAAPPLQKRWVVARVRFEPHWNDSPCREGRPRARRRIWRHRRTTLIKIGLNTLIRIPPYES